MPDLESFTFTCSGPGDLILASHDFHRRVPWEVWSAFADVFNDYLVRYTLEETFARVNGRTVAQIVAEYTPGGLPVIATGQIDGVQYTLFKAAEPNVAPDPRRLDGSGES